MSPDEDASSDPGGDVFDLQDDLGDWFKTIVHDQNYVIEARGEDVLTQAVLWELYQNTQEFLAIDKKGALGPPDLPDQPYLYQAFDTDTDRSFVGLNTIADEVQRVLSGEVFDTTLESASDDQIKLAVHLLLADTETASLRDALSVEARSEKRVVSGMEIDYWTSSALMFGVFADNEKLGGASAYGRSLGGDDSELVKEEFNRNVQEIIRGEQRTYKAWGIAIDLNMEAEDEGKTAAVFIMLTVVAAVIVVGISLRSYWAMALTGAGLAERHLQSCWPERRPHHRADCSDCDDCLGRGLCRSCHAPLPRGENPWICPSKSVADRIRRSLGCVGAGNVK